MAMVMGGKASHNLSCSGVALRLAKADGDGVAGYSAMIGRSRRGHNIGKGDWGSTISNLGYVKSTNFIAPDFYFVRCIL